MITQEDVMSMLGPFATHTNTEDQSSAVTCYKDGINRIWRGRTMCIPKAGHEPDYIDKMIEHQNGIMIVKARTNKPWFQKLMRNADAILLVQGNLPMVKGGSTIGSGIGYAMAAFGIENLKKIERALELKIINGEIIR